MKVLFFLSLLTVSVNAFSLEKLPKYGGKNGLAIEWPFVGVKSWAELKLNIGTPAQQIDVEIDMQGVDDLRIAGKAFGGDYDVGSSSSYFMIGNAFDTDGQPIGDYGTETFQLDEQSLTDRPFILQFSVEPLKTFIGLGPVRSQAEGRQNFTFVDTVLRDVEDGTLTIAYDNYPASGALTFGGLDNKRCFNDWTFTDEQTWINKKEDNPPERWGFTATKISAGKFSASNQINVSVELYDGIMFWPRDLVASIANGLGSPDGSSIPCNTKQTIDFQAGDMHFSLKPDSYLDRNSQTGSCYLYSSSFPDTKEIILSQRFFKNLCLSVNHYTKQIGISNRVN